MPSILPFGTEFYYISSIMRKDGPIPHYLKLKVPTIQTINEITSRFVAYIPNDIIVAGYEAGKCHYSDPEETCQKK